jgi:Phytanoyl-CoA dioxygenase (PhyH)
MALTRLSKRQLLNLLLPKFTLSDAKAAALKREGERVFAHGLSQSDIATNVEGPDDLASIQRAATLLEQLGVVVIGGLVAPSMARKAAAEFTSFVEEAKRNLEEKTHFESDLFLAQADMSALKSSTELSRYAKPVLNLRKSGKNRPDGGMIDFFGFQKIIGRFDDLNACHTVMRSEPIRRIIERQGRSEVRARNLSIYYNKSVTNTRVLHVDNLAKTYKVFLYLTDVESLAQGPYMYVPGSHLKKGHIGRTINRNRFYRNVSETDMYLDREHAIPLLGEAGTVIISCQAGLHGGFPQEEGSLRIVMVDHY